MRADLDMSGMRDLARSDEVHDALVRAGEAMADNARKLAPGGRYNRASKEGIAVEEELTSQGWEVHVGHVIGVYGFHLRMQEFGTRFQSPQPHLRPAASMRVRL